MVRRDQIPEDGLAVAGTAGRNRHAHSQCPPGPLILSPPEDRRQWAGRSLEATILDTSQDAIIAIDDESRVVIWNPSAQRILGFSREEALGRPIVDLIIPVFHRRILNRRLARYRHSWESTVLGRRIQVTALRKSGEEFSAELSISSGRPGIDGSPLIVAHLRDISESKATEEARRQCEASLRAIIDSSKSVVYLKDPGGHYQLINRKWAELFGVTQESVVGQTDHDIFPVEIADAFRSNDLRILEGGRPVDLEEIAPHSDGPHVYLSSKVPLIGRDGLPYAICGISTDITERKKIEESLRRSEEQFRVAFEAAAIGMALVAPEGRWIKVNRALCEIVGYTKEELLTTTFQAITHPDDLENNLEMRRRSQAGQEGPFHMEKRYLRKDGEIVWVRLSISQVRDIQGQPLHSVAQIEDITPRKRAEARTRALHAELEEAYDATIAGWARALDLRDHETEGHCRRVTEMTTRLARALGLPEADIVNIRRGALLHDIGKMGVPDSILRKPGPLDESEWAIMRRHPQYALEMLSPIAFLEPSLGIPYSHHERWDGRGYPQGLSGEEIPLSARIFAAVDIWDALSHDRPYRKAWPADRVRAYLQSLAGTHLDQTIVEAFLNLLKSDKETTENAGRSSVEAARTTLKGPGPGDDNGVVDAISNPHRLEALRQTGLMDSPAELAFDRLVRLATKTLNAPMALVSLVDDRRQFFKSEHGVPEPWASLRETPLSHSFCREVVRTSAPLIISDARLDPRVCENSAVAELGIIAYAGIPLATPAGHVLGSFCVIDGHPRPWDEAELEILRDLAASVMTEIELRGEVATRRRAEGDLRRSRSRVAKQLRNVLKLNRELERERGEMEQANAQLAEMASTDGLTGLKNRRHLADALAKAHSLATRTGSSMSIILADVDEFKHYNDTFGHAAGDDVLRAVASMISGQLRTQDLAARYGGEEFVVLLPEVDEAEAVQVAERLRVAVEAWGWPHRPVTASFGVATSSGGGGNPWTLVDEADAAMYTSKRLGRNRVTHHRVPAQASTAISEFKEGETKA